jgi:two-component system cell cycle sensor histidine kinase/response regulator CckA
VSRDPDVADHQARVLIVDDELHNRRLLEVMLAPEGFALLTASSGAEALAIVSRQAPDLILLDIMMPGIDGYEVAATLKKQPATKNIPIIMVSALDDRNARMLGLSAGAEDFLTKPVDRAELTVRVRNLLRLKAYGDYHDEYSQFLETEVSARTIDLRHERDRAQRYLDTAAVILLALDRGGLVTLANRHACDTLGWPTQELLGLSWFDTCVPSRLRDASRTRFASVLRGDISTFETSIVARSGEELMIEWHCTIVRDDAGTACGVLKSGTDITERTRAVEALRAAEERMRFALENSGVGIWDMDPATGTVRWSETLETQYGLGPGTFAGTFEAFAGCIHPDDRAAVLETVEQAMKSGEDFSVTNRSIWPDGTVRWLSGAGRFHRGQHGEPSRGVGISQDVTERRTLEQQYLQAQKMDAIGRMASGVAHDFNNLLTVILGFAELVSADLGATTKNGVDLGEAIKAARQAAGLTKQLLAFSRQQVLHAAPLDVNALITNMTAMLARLIGEHIDVSLVLAPDLSSAFADRGQLEQVLMNLVVNARDAMPDGGRVTIETMDVELENSVFHEAEVVPGRYVMLAVTDTGCGMTPETQRRLFEPFFTTKEVGQGTGLGLSTTYGIVKQSKGYIWVYSEQSHGTTFKVYVPRATQDIVADAIAQPTLAPQEQVSETVLLVEDEAGVRHLSKRILDSAGYRVLEASNGDDAEVLFVRHADSIALVVTDVMMPGCGGPELLTRLQARAPALKVLFMSGYSELSAGSKSRIGPGFPFVQKPFTASEFVRHVRAALDR